MRSRRRLAALLVAAPLAVSFASSPAQARPIVEGCYGAGAYVYCDPTLRVSLVETGSEPTPICAGTCTEIDVPTVGTRPDRYSVCLDYETREGWPASECVVDLSRDEVQDATEALLEFVRCTVNPRSC
jgi:hypothetical protein